MIIARIEGDDLIYEFWGTKDGRQVTLPEKAKVYNIISPGPVKYIETDELKPGEKKRVERAISGADAEFDYIVLYPNGEEKKTTFYSRYVAWPEVWLVGRDPNAATSTDELVNKIIDAQ